MKLVLQDLKKLHLKDLSHKVEICTLLKLYQWNLSKDLIRTLLETLRLKFIHPRNSQSLLVLLLELQTIACQLLELTCLNKMVKEESVEAQQQEVVLVLELETLAKREFQIHSNLKNMDKNLLKTLQFLMLLSHLQANQLLQEITMSFYLSLLVKQWTCLSLLLVSINLIVGLLQMRLVRVSILRIWMDLIQ